MARQNRKVAMAKLRHTKEVTIPTWLMTYKENSICQEGNLSLASQWDQNSPRQKKLIQTSLFGRKGPEPFLPLTLRMN
jgi:hypothetical protein